MYINQDFFANAFFAGYAYSVIFVCISEYLSGIFVSVRGCFSVTVCVQQSALP